MAHVFYFYSFSLFFLVFLGIEAGLCHPHDDWWNSYIHCDKVSTSTTVCDSDFNGSHVCHQHSPSSIHLDHFICCHTFALTPSYGANSNNDSQHIPLYCAKTHLPIGMVAVLELQAQVVLVAPNCCEVQHRCAVCQHRCVALIHRVAFRAPNSSSVQRVL